MYKRIKRFCCYIFPVRCLATVCIIHFFFSPHSMLSTVVLPFVLCIFFGHSLFKLQTGLKEQRKQEQRREERTTRNQKQKKITQEKKVQIPFMLYARIIEKRKANGKKRMKINFSFVLFSFILTLPHSHYFFALFQSRFVSLSKDIYSYTEGVRAAHTHKKNE